MADLDDFSQWLSCKLLDLRIDDSDRVYGPYIRGILDSDDSNDEKIEAIDGLLSGVCDPEVNNLTTICKEVLHEWTKFFAKEKSSGILEEAVIDSKLSQLLESQNLATTKIRAQSIEQRKMKEAILNQYSHMTDDDDDDEDCGEMSATQEARIQKNTNAQVVAQEEKDKRQQAKEESQKKKDKDKEDREKQKQVKEDRKEKVKRKTQKVERRR